MKKENPSRDLLWFGVGLILGVFLTRRRTGAAGAVSPLAAWERALAARYGARRAAILGAKVQARYVELFAGRPRFSNSALRDHFEARILPGIALYRVLREETPDAEEALAALDSCFAAHIQASSRSRLTRRLLDHLPGGFKTLGFLNRAVLRSSFPEQGWQIQWVEDSPACIAYDITSCFYQDMLNAYGVPELTAHFCAGDDLMYGGLETISWERTETLGRGDARCNFVFRPRVQPQGRVL